jgi:hypothetical protein
MQPLRRRDAETDAEKSKKIIALDFLRALCALGGNKNFYRKDHKEREEEKINCGSFLLRVSLCVSAVAFPPIQFKPDHILCRPRDGSGRFASPPSRRRGMGHIC